MMTVDEERQTAHATGIIEPLPVVAGDSRVLVGGKPPAVDIRLISEGQYRALMEVWVAHGGKVAGARNGK